MILKIPPPLYDEPATKLHQIMPPFDLLIPQPSDGRLVLQYTQQQHADTVQRVFDVLCSNDRSTIGGFAASTNLVATFI